MGVPFVQETFAPIAELNVLRAVAPFVTDATVGLTVGAAAAYVRAPGAGPWMVGWAT
jgi:hypothetical protein